jgi:3-methyladenine DNA glycosylase AlkD
LAVLDRVISLDEIGSYVLAGKILQLRLESNYKQSLSKAVDYIIKGDKWYACDIISERVMGHSLLTTPAKTIPILKKLALNENKWIIRSVGVTAHYAVKKGLSYSNCEKVFKLLLEHSGTTDFHTKKGIGWGAKTTAKFHPEIISKNSDKIYGDTEVKQWFKTKIKIGLLYSKKYSRGKLKL